MDTFASLFSGGGLADVGARQSGLVPVWGIECDTKVAGLYQRNIGDHLLVSRVQDVDYASLQIPYWLHMSPPCINASHAKTNGGETELDIEMANACCEAIKVLQPPMISLENVWGYRLFPVSFPLILRVLCEQGYAFDYWHLNAANYGVPQTRKRLFLVASRVQQPRRPAQTHQSSKKQSVQLSLFPFAPWVGWYGAIEDLIPDLPDDEFAPWQIPLLPAEIRSMLVAQGKYGNKLVTVNDDEPSFTVTANSNQSGIRGVLVRCDNTKQKWGRGYRDASDPSIAVTSRDVKAWLVNQDSKLGTYQADSPAMTVLSSEKSAFIRAFLADGTANSRGQGLTVRGGDSRAITASASQEKRVLRAYAGGRVVRMTARAVARFQSVPDDYCLTGKKGLDFKAIGNAVPPLMQQCVIEAQRGA
jgi:site-specific DNA-cytosine methylase